MEFVTDQLCIANLGRAFPVWKARNLSVVSDGPAFFIEFIGAGIGFKPLEGLLDFLGGATTEVTRGKLWTTTAHEDGNHVPAGSISEQTLRRFAEGKAFDAIRALRSEGFKRPCTDKILRTHSDSPFRWDDSESAF